MAQRTSGVMSILSAPAVYEGVQRAVGAARVRRELVARYLRPRPGDAVLDIGCGPADVLAALPDVRYVGFDLSAAYVAAAQRRFGARGTFFTGSVDSVEPSGLGRFDLVLAQGVLHHLDDAQAVKTMRLARQVLREDGRLVTIDPLRCEEQSPAARFLVNADRGRNVRGEEGYRALAQQVFDRVASHRRHDLLRLPYSHLILDCGP